MGTTNRPQDRRSDRPDAPGDRARPPGELLDNLRLRLSQLADNHPSAPGNSRARWPRPEQPRADQARPDQPGTDQPGGGESREEEREKAAGEAGTVPGGLVGEPAGAGSGFVEAFSELHEGVDPGIAGADVADGSAGPGSDGAGPGSDGSGWAGDAARSAAAAVATGLGVLGSMELPGRAGQHEPYRPWFMAGEPGSPWWSGAIW